MPAGTRPGGLPFRAVSALSSMLTHLARLADIHVMDQASESASSRPPSRLGKLVFLAAVVAVAAAVWWAQRGGGEWDGWEQDLPAARRQAAQQHRPLLVLFTSDPIDHDARRLKETTLTRKENRQALLAGRYILVVARVATGLKDELSRKYDLRRLPTLLVLDADDKVLARAEGFVGETAFRQQFLPKGTTSSSPASFRNRTHGIYGTYGKNGTSIP